MNPDSAQFHYWGSPKECDDGNTTRGDGCDDKCRIEQCGNDRWDVGEDCDDGNTVNGDGCNEWCQSEWVCGNGIVHFHMFREECDDGNTLDGDGCSSLCKWEDPPTEVVVFDDFEITGDRDNQTVHGRWILKSHTPLLSVTLNPDASLTFTVSPQDPIVEWTFESYKKDAQGNEKDHRTQVEVYGFAPNTFTLDFEFNELRICLNDCIVGYYTPIRLTGSGWCWGYDQVWGWYRVTLDSSIALSGNDEAKLICAQEGDVAVQALGGNLMRSVFIDSGEPIMPGYFELQDIFSGEIASKGGFGDIEDSVFFDQGSGVYDTNCILLPSSPAGKLSLTYKGVNVTSIVSPLERITYAVSSEGADIQGYCDWGEDGCDGPDDIMKGVECIEMSEKDCCLFGGFTWCQAADTDNDGIIDLNDNCPFYANPDQADCNTDGLGDACDKINPNAEEVCDDSDNDCDGQIDEGIYLFGGFQQPINPDGSSIFEAGRTIPVKVMFTDCSAQPISTANAIIDILMVSDSILGTEEEQEVESSGNANSGNFFRYDETEGLYIFNLSTKYYNTGTYRVYAKLDNNEEYSIEFSLK